MITTQILIQNNENCIEETLKSIVDLGPIIIGNRGSTDKTIDICKKFKCKIYKIYENFSESRQYLAEESDTSWQLFLNPGEILVGNPDLNGRTKYLRIFENNLITKEIRIWNKKENIKFKNPVFEYIQDTNSTMCKDALIYSNYTIPDFTQEILEWKKAQPGNPSPYYYEACNFIKNKKFKEFLSSAEKYLFMDKSGMSVIMMTYYVALVKFFTGDINESLQKTIQCIGSNCLMSEFWCLLGDIFYKTNKFDKAVHFYENGKILGSQRKVDDLWPVDIPKYGKYPDKMIQSCKEMLSSKLYQKI
jgi:tetratricopeptide (TPR) repeat protein